MELFEVEQYQIYDRFDKILTNCIDKFKSLLEYLCFVKITRVDINFGTIRFEDYNEDVFENEKIYDYFKYIINSYESCHTIFYDFKNDKTILFNENNNFIFYFYKDVKTIYDLIEKFYHKEYRQYKIEKILKNTSNVVYGDGINH